MAGARRARRSSHRRAPDHYHGSASRQGPAPARESARRGGSAPKRSASGAALAASGILGLGIALAAIIAMRSASGGDGCSAKTTLNVTTNPTIAPAVVEVAARYDNAKRRVGGRCARVKVTSIASATVSAALGQSPGGDVGDTPDVWIPESANWLTVARTSPAAAQLVPATGPTIGTSPVVIATPRPLGVALGWPDKQLRWADVAANEGKAAFWSAHGHSELGAFKVVLPDPATSIASARAVIAVAAAGSPGGVKALTDASFTKDRGTQVKVLNLERNAAVVPNSVDDMTAALHQAQVAGTAKTYLSAAPMLESQMVAYNRGTSGDGGIPSVPLVASYPSDGSFTEITRYAVLAPAAADPARAAVARDFLSSLTGNDGRSLLSAIGLRDATGNSMDLTANLGVVPNPPAIDGNDPSAARLPAARTLFQHLHQRGSTLAVIDVSGSMKEQVPPSGRTKLQLVVAACIQAVPLFARDDYVGNWRFSTDLENGKDYEEVSPIARIDSPGAHGGNHAADLKASLQALKPEKDTALYETALAAYKVATSKYLPGRLNQVVLLTDGENDNPNDSLTLDGLITALRGLYNPQKPVRIITIAYGTGADPTALRKISAATDARSYTARDPNQIFDVFIDAVSQGGT